MENKMKRIGIFTALLLSSAIMLGACAGSRSPDQPDLEGTSWVLTAINESSPIESAQPTLEFKGGQATGNASCNTFGGSYQVEGGAIAFGDLHSTEMFCMDPEGAMEQEQMYLDLLRRAQNFELVNGRLRIFTDSEETLTFQEEGSIIKPSPTPDRSEPTPEPTPDPTPVPTFQPPAGFQEYRDPVTDVSIFIPVSWYVTGIIEGKYAILQSYPEDKYVGGEARDPGDTKCDLSIRPAGETEADIIQAWESSDRTTILAATEIILGSGEPAMRFELNSMGPADVVLTRVRDRVVILTCFGDFTLFDEIAGTLRAAD
jgi:heat shock protein HslJ